MSARDDGGAPRRARRRIDRATDPTVTDRLAELPTAEVRSLRDDCRDEEARLSYLRRLLHGRLDIARAEAGRRGGDGDDDSDGVLDRLPEILAGDAGPSGTARALGLYEPGQSPGRRTEDRILDDTALARLPELDDAELARVVSELEDVERQISDQRRAVLENLDALQAELVARYRDGRAAIGEVLAPDAGDPGAEAAGADASGADAAGSSDPGASDPGADHPGADHPGAGDRRAGGPGGGGRGGQGEPR